MWALHERHECVIEVLVHDPVQTAQVRQEIEERIASFSNLVQAIGTLGEATPRALDTTRLIATDNNSQSAVPDLIVTETQTRVVLEPMLAEGQIPVVTGFIGVTPLGAVLLADEVLHRLIEPAEVEAKLLA